MSVEIISQEMLEAAENLDFDIAAHMRAEIAKVEKELEKSL